MQAGRQRKVGTQQAASIARWAGDAWQAGRQGRVVPRRLPPPFCGRHALCSPPERVAGSLGKKFSCTELTFEDRCEAAWLKYFVWRGLPIDNCDGCRKGALRRSQAPPEAVQCGAVAPLFGYPAGCLHHLWARQCLCRLGVASKLIPSRLPSPLCDQAMPLRAGWQR